MPLRTRESESDPPQDATAPTNKTVAAIRVTTDLNITSYFPEPLGGALGTDLGLPFFTRGAVVAGPLPNFGIRVVTVGGRVVAVGSAPFFVRAGSFGGIVVTFDGAFVVVPA